MIKLYGYIENITTSSIRIRTFNFELHESLLKEASRNDMEEMFVFPCKITLRFKKELIDSIIEHAKFGFCNEFQVENGFVQSVKLYKTAKTIHEEREAYMTIIRAKDSGFPKPLRDKLQLVLRTIIDCSRETGFIHKETIINRLKEAKIDRKTAETLIQQLLRDGTIYSPRENYLKKS